MERRLIKTRGCGTCGIHFGRRPLTAFGAGDRLIVQNRVRLAGLDARKDVEHSLRSGFITEGRRRGITLGDLMALSGHKSLTAALGHYQARSVG